MSSLREEIPAWLAGAAAVSAVVSIAAMEILMGAAIIALVITRTRWRVPPIWIPFAAFVILTLISLAANGHFREGFPQVKKMYVYLMLVVVTSAIGSVRQVRWIATGWAIAAAASSVWALNQFYNKYEDAVDAHQNFYNAYVADRITGFTDHWMTFSNQMMMAVLIVGAFVFFSNDRRWIWWMIGAGVLISIALILNETRSVWLATAIGGGYLTWFWRRWVLLAAPVAMAVLVLANPFAISERVLSPFKPHGDVDSTKHRTELRAIGWRMIQAHPLLGVGPEQVSRHIGDYMPEKTARPRTSEYYGHLENDYIQYAAERGVPAMLALMCMIAKALVDFARGLARASADQKWLLHGAIAVIVAILIAGWFSWNLNTSTVLGMFMAVIGCGYVALREQGA
jgi:putative inorganic carbon (hco3(-)) transporter